MGDLNHVAEPSMLSKVMPCFRFATYNIRKGKGASGRWRGSGRGSVERLTKALATHHLDILLCQEVFHTHTQVVAQSFQISQALGLASYYEPNRFRRMGHHGNATFTRYPVEHIQNYDVSTNRLERRGVLHVRLNVHNRLIHVFNAHLGLNQRQRLLQIRRIGEIIYQVCQADEAVVLAGDFNDWNGYINHVVVSELGLQNIFAHAKGLESLTWHARHLVFNLDRVYVRYLKPLQTQRFSGQPWNELSDHCPLWAKLAFEDDTAGNA